MLGRMCLYVPFWKYELLRNKLAMCELLSYERILDLCYELCKTMNSIRFRLLIKLELADPEVRILDQHGYVLNRVC